MFYGGCCLLPWVWGLSIIYFWKLYRSETCPPGIKKYITQSIQGLIFSDDFIWNFGLSYFKQIKEKDGHNHC